MRNKIRGLFILSLFCVLTALAVAGGSITSKAPLSTSNATVPGSAPILPAQAYVDCIPLMFTDTDTIGSVGWVLSNKGITHFDARLLYTTASDPGYPSNGFLIAAGGVVGLDLSGNALSTSEVNAILAAAHQLRTDQGPVTGPESNGFVPILKLDGGTNGAPTGQGITDKTYLTGTALWTVTTN